MPKKEKLPEIIAPPPPNLLPEKHTFCLICNAPLLESVNKGRSLPNRVLFCSTPCKQTAARLARAGKFPTAKEIRERMNVARLNRERELAEDLAVARRQDFTPDDSRRLRSQIGVYVSEQIKNAHEVVMGRREWSPTQARVFGTFMNKVIPDLSASFVQKSDVTRPLTEYTQAELEEIIRQAATLEATATSEEIES